MLIGILEMELYIFESYSLKDKRRVLKSIIEKTRGKFNISISEIEDCDTWNKSIIGISTVSNSSTHINKILTKVFSFIADDIRVEILNHNIEII